jgi:coenzyme F420 hydrogenase subunit beta
MVDAEDQGLRPRLDPTECGACDACVQVCPGVSAGQQAFTNAMAELVEGWGNVLEVWEGCAADADVRFVGSSGGLASALALYCLEKGGMSGVLHTGPDPGQPLKNKTHFSQSRTELVERTGSRYAPASPGDGIGLIEGSSGPSVFVGKGCDVEAVRKAEGVRPGLGAKLGLAIGIFCAGTPSTQATRDLLTQLAVDPDSVADIRYRGKGWPGNFTVMMRDGRPSVSIPYTEAWGFLQKYRPHRCYLCPDATAELADISCGDPWYREVKEDPQGFSLVLVRTERGREIVRGAIEAGYVVLERRAPDVLVASQRGMLDKRGAIWGRMLAMQMFGIPTPRYEGFHLYENWKRLPAGEKARAFLGTIRRIVTRGYYRAAKA